MAEGIINLFKLMKIFRERGNWKMIRRSRKQLADFIFCRDGLNKKSPLKIIPYWLYMLKGLDMLVWRLETFGFIYPSGLSAEDKERLNRYL